jgi:hypothetical protein
MPMGLEGSSELVLVRPSSDTCVDLGLALFPHLAVAARPDDAKPAGSPSFQYGFHLGSQGSLHMKVIQDSCGIIVVYFTMCCIS